MGSEWPELTIDQLKATGKGSIAMGPFGSRIKAENFQKEGVPVIKGGNLHGAIVTDDKFDFLTEEKAEELKSSQAVKRDLVITHRGTIGQVCIIPDDAKFEKYIVSQSQLKVTLDEDVVDPYFVNYFFQSHIGQHRLLANASQVGVPAIAKASTSVKEILVPVPPLPEQKAIAHILGTLDDKIELNRRMNATLEGMAQALFKSWFVDFDPVIDNALAAGNPIPDELAPRAEVRKNALANGTTQQGSVDHPTLSDPKALFPAAFKFTEELGWIPEGWEIKHIGDIANVVDCLHSKKPDQINEETGRVLLQLNNICDDGILDLQKKYYIKEEDYQKWISRIEVTEGDCVITNVGRVGAVSIVPPGFNGAIGRNITAIRLKADTRYRAFLITLLTSQYMEEEIRLRTDVGTILDALNVKSIPHLRFASGGQKIFESFERLILPILIKRQKTKSDSLVLAKLRDTLLPKLISGELRSPEAERLAKKALA